MANIGNIAFEINGESVAVREGWNPDDIPADKRTMIAQELERIAGRIRRGWFMDGETCKRFKSPKGPATP